MASKKPVPAADEIAGVAVHEVEPPPPVRPKATRKPRSKKVEAAVADPPATVATEAKEAVQEAPVVKDSGRVDVVPVQVGIGGRSRRG